ncbi:LacI family DNA-binding transcriptional regulator [Microbacterium sp. NPDC055683]
MATIHDVAKAAGVSAMTVSNVLNDRPHVRAETREKVLRAIAELDYRVNPAARRLRSARTGTIGLAVPDIAQPYFGVLASHVVEAAGRRGLRVTVEQTSAARDRELEAVALSRRLMIDGLILSALGVSVDDLRAIDYPLVLVGEKDLADELPQVSMPNEEGARVAVAHLLATGSRRIAVLGGIVEDGGMASERLAGYRRAHVDAGLTPDPALAVPAERYGIEGGAAAAAELLRRGAPFDGVFCMTDAVALGALHALVGAGLRVPEDVQLVGFDDVPAARYANPAISTVSPDHAFIAETAVALLERRIAGEDLPARRRTVSPFSLTLRGTTRRA